MIYLTLRYIWAIAKCVTCFFYEFEGLLHIFNNAQLLKKTQEGAIESCYMVVQ